MPPTTTQDRAVAQANRGSIAKLIHRRASRVVQVRPAVVLGAVGPHLIIWISIKISVDLKVRCKCWHPTVVKRKTCAIKAFS